VKLHRYMICGVAATIISGCGVFTECCVVCDYTHTTRHAVDTPQPEIHAATTLQNL